MEIKSPQANIISSKDCGTHKNLLTRESNETDKGKNGRNGDTKRQVESESFQLEKQAIKSSLSGIQDWPIYDSTSVHVHLLDEGPKTKHLLIKGNL